MKTLLLIPIVFGFTICFSQSKKEQIEDLTQQLEQSQKEVTKLSSELINAQQEIVSTQQSVIERQNSLDAKDKENEALRQRINTQKDSIRDLIIMNAVLKTRQDSILNTLNNQQFNKKNFNENNYDMLVKKMNKSNDNSTGNYNIIGWLKSRIEVLGSDYLGSSEFFSSQCSDYINDVMNSFLGYPGSMSQEDLQSKWGNIYDIKYAFFKHPFETGDCSWQTRMVHNITYLGELNEGKWFKIEIIGGCNENDYSDHLVRVVKVIGNNNKFEVSNLLALPK